MKNELYSGEQERGPEKDGRAGQVRVSVSKPQNPQKTERLRMAANY